MAFLKLMIKKYRVRKNEDFSKIIKKRKSIVDQSFIVYYYKKQESHSRVGISVSKKLGNAVERNKIKRQVRMMFANIYDFENSPSDLVVIVRKGYLEKSFSDNQNNLEKLIKKAIII